MIGGSMAGLVARPAMRAALRWGAAALAVLLFLLALRRAGERAGWLAETLETMETTHACNARCSTPRRVGLVIATIWLAGCATAGSDRPSVVVCPPVVPYDAAFLARSADEVEALPDGSALAEMIADYGVMREQARACGGS